MSAARQLRNWGFKVVVVEGHDRLGGRVHGHRLEVSAGRQVDGCAGGWAFRRLDVLRRRWWCNV